MNTATGRTDLPAAATKPNLSELEGAVLAVVWREGPITPYALRRVAGGSRSPHLSTSAGSIYPLVDRMAARGLIEGEAILQGRREGTAYRITRIGLAELRAWISQSECAVLSGALVDPIRTRLLMLSALPRGKRRGVIARLVNALEDDLERLMAKRKEFASLEDPYALAAWRGDLLVQRARLKWLREVEEQMR